MPDHGIHTAFRIYRTAIKCRKIFQCGRGNSDYSQCKRSHGAGISMADELSVDTYNFINCYDYTQTGGMFSPISPAYGTIIHEYIHTLGLPDLYRYYASFDPHTIYYSDGTNSGICLKVTSQTENTITFNVLHSASEENSLHHLLKRDDGYEDIFMEHTSNNTVNRREKAVQKRVVM